MRCAVKIIPNNKSCSNSFQWLCHFFRMAHRDKTTKCYLRQERAFTQYIYKHRYRFFSSYRFLGRQRIGSVKVQAKLKCNARGYYTTPSSSISSNILSDMFSGILSNISYGILSGISSGISHGILSSISSGILSDILSSISSGILSGR